MMTLLRSLVVVLLFAGAELKAQLCSFYGMYVDGGWYFFDPCYGMEFDGFEYHFWCLNHETGYWDEYWLWKDDWRYVQIEWHR